MAPVSATAYESSAGRHLDDALLLLDAARFDNAAYLSGYAVECSLKVLIEASGHPPKQYQHELELATLSGRALLLACMLVPGIRRYSFPRSADFQAMTHGWRPDLRYQRSGSVSKVQAETWLQVARDVYQGIVVESVLDGWTKP